MKTVGIVTIMDISNYGNRLQNYALQKFLSNKKIIAYTIWDTTLKKILKKQIKRLPFFRKKFERINNFEKFNDNFLNLKLNFSNNIKPIYDYYIVGSDQVWNYNFSSYNSRMFLDFSAYDKNISYAASFGIDSVPEEKKDEYYNGLKNIKYISVREDTGKKIINEIDKEKKVDVLIDPTMLLSQEEWNQVLKKPKCLNNQQYILLYFLGELSLEKRIEIERIASENNCEVINLLDNSSPFYNCGPSEFLYLEKNAFLICTDSFHSSVFALIFNRPFVIFDREQKDMSNMNSRIDTLISKFNLKNRKFEGKISEENLNHDYNEAYKILEVERQKSVDFLEKALDIKK